MTTVGWVELASLLVSASAEHYFKKLYCEQLIRNFHGLVQSVRRLLFVLKVKRILNSISRNLTEPFELFEAPLVSILPIFSQSG